MHTIRMSVAVTSIQYNCTCMQWWRMCHCTHAWTYAHAHVCHTHTSIQVAYCMPGSVVSMASPWNLDTWMYVAIMHADDRVYTVDTQRTCTSSGMCHFWRVHFRSGASSRGWCLHHWNNVSFYLLNTVSDTILKLLKLCRHASCISAISECMDLLSS